MLLLEILYMKKVTVSGKILLFSTLIVNIVIIYIFGNLIASWLYLTLNGPL